MDNDSFYNFLDSAIVPKDTLNKIVENREYNEVIKGYYYKFAKNGGSVTFSSDNLLKKVSSIDFCNKLWVVDFYSQNNIKDFIKTSLCKNKFCSNCKKVRQAERMARYIPYLETYKNNLYHCTLTIPNVDGILLRATIKKMSACFRQLNRYLRLTDKINGLDFSSLGYKGAIRSLEVTFKGDSYHPHYHVAFCFEDLILDDKDKTILNTFSYKHGKITRLFHPFEILIQKIWFLLYNNKTVNVRNINSLDIGYSCTLDKFSNGNYVELFKYMVKEVDENKNVLTYDNFIALEYALYNMKQIQPYGDFCKIKKDDYSIEAFDSVYDAFIKHLLDEEQEIPCREYSPTKDLLDNYTSTTLISRKSFFKYYNESLRDS